MTALNIFQTAKITTRGPVLPMSAEDRRFWQLRERRERERSQPLADSQADR